MDEPRVVIAIPHLGDLPEYFVRSLLGVTSWKQALCYVSFVENHPVDLARNLLVEGMLDRTDATHIFFMDADMVFPAAALERLLAADKPIVTGTYFARSETPIPHVYNFARTDDAGVDYYTTLGREFAEWAKRVPQELDLGNAGIIGDPYLVECEAAGAGCLLIRREVLEAVYEAHSDDAYPWFKLRAGSKGGEDFGFFKRVKALGYPVFADFSVQCNHEASGSFTGREEFIECFSIGTPEEHDFDEPILVELGPQGQRRLRTQPLVSPATPAERPSLLAPRFAESRKRLFGLVPR